MDILRFFIVLGILIIVHEFGHFLAARRMGVKVEKFAIGFGPAIFKRRIKDFDFLVCCIPLGGYVKLAGDNIQDYKGAKDEYFAQAPGRRALIVGAGPLFNYILAWFLFALIFTIGFPAAETGSTIGALKEGYPAQMAGLLPDDTIIEINSEKIDDWQRLTEIIHDFKGEYLQIKVQREDLILDFSIQPIRETQEIFGKKHQISLIGISPKMSMIKYPFYKAAGRACIHLYQLTVLTVKVLFRIFTGSIPLRDSLVGPLGMYVISSDVSRMGFVPLLSFVGLLSMSLSIFNFLPLPVLDGGHLFFLFLEKLRKRPLAPKVEEIINQVGMAILITLAVFVFYNDFVRFGSRIFGK